VEILNDRDAVLEARVYPDKAAGPAATLTKNVAEAAAREGWHIDEIHTEEGRLDEVFRTITLPDTVKAAA
jgi:ABC-2 type transport system ATP-binding protein